MPQHQFRSYDNQLNDHKTTCLLSLDPSTRYELLTKALPLHTEITAELPPQRSTNNAPWWIAQLEKSRAKTRTLFNRAKRTGDLTPYKHALTEYHNLIRKAKRSSWRQFCQEINNTNTYAHMNKLFAKNNFCDTMGSLTKPDGDEHIEYVTKTATRILWTCKRFCGNKWGINPKMAWWIYKAIVRPVITYASIAWWHRASIQANRQKLEKVQRLGCIIVTGAVKRLSAQASLRMVYNKQIMTPRQLYDWAKENITNISFIYSSLGDYENEKSLLKTRLEEGKTVKGTQQFHHYKPQNETRVLVKIYSFSNDTKEEVVSKNDVDSDLELDEIVGFVTCLYDKEWWLGCVIGIENEDIKISFLEPHGPLPSFKYPRVPDVLLVNKSDVLTKVDPTTQTGRVYHLTELESRKATKKLQSKMQKENRP